MKEFTDTASNPLHFSEVPIVVQNHYPHFAKDVDIIYFFLIQIRKELGLFLH